IFPVFFCIAVELFGFWLIHSPVSGTLNRAMDNTSHISINCVSKWKLQIFCEAGTIISSALMHREANVFLIYAN
ncbi:MAG: hypothetical protein IKN59_07375, partial [Paludibacteraceae bacterium]|nr:hypothetical protein [Paludibacteraceae bacterium]